MYRLTHCSNIASMFPHLCRLGLDKSSFQFPSILSDTLCWGDPSVSEPAILAKISAVLSLSAESTSLVPP